MCLGGSEGPYYSGRTGSDGAAVSNAVCFFGETPRPDVSVTVNGSPIVWTDARPFLDQSGRTMVPLRAVADAMGLTVSWDSDKRAATFSKGKRQSITFPIGSKTATSTKGKINMDTTAIISGERTYAPARYLAEFFGYTVNWNDTTKTVILKS